MYVGEDVVQQHQIMQNRYDASKSIKIKRGKEKGGIFMAKFWKIAPKPYP